MRNIVGTPVIFVTPYCWIVCITLLASKRGSKTTVAAAITAGKHSPMLPT